MGSEIVDEHQKLSDDERDNLDQYQINKQSEVVRSLRILGRKRELLTLFFDAGKRSFPTSIITVIPERDLVVFERTGSDHLDGQLLKKKRGTVVGQPSGVKIRFILQSISVARFKGEKVFIAPLPKEYYRFQKREFFRVDTPIINPVTVTLKLPDGTPATLRASDLSSGGLRIDDVDHIIEFEMMKPLQGCTISIPDAPPFETNLVMRNSYEVPNRKGEQVHHVGCAFKNLRVGHETVVQNYINHLQIALRAKENAQ